MTREETAKRRLMEKQAAIRELQRDRIDQIHALTHEFMRDMDRAVLIHEALAIFYIRDSKNNKVRVGEFIRVAFEYNYNSCNWGYVADFEVVSYTSNKGKTWFRIESFAQKTDKENPIISFPVSLGVTFGIESRKVKVPCSEIRNCTGDERWISCKKTDRDSLFDLNII